MQLQDFFQWITFLVTPVAMFSNLICHVQINCFQQRLTLYRSGMEWNSSVGMVLQKPSTPSANFQGEILGCPDICFK